MSIRFFIFFLITHLGSYSLLFFLICTQFDFFLFSFLFSFLYHFFYLFSLNSLLSLFLFLLLLTPFFHYHRWLFLFLLFDFLFIPYLIYHFLYSFLRGLEFLVQSYFITASSGHTLKVIFCNWNQTKHRTFKYYIILGGQSSKIFSIN